MRPIGTIIVGVVPTTSEPGTTDSARWHGNMAQVSDKPALPLPLVSESALRMDPEIAVAARGSDRLNKPLMSEMGRERTLAPP